MISSKRVILDLIIHRCNNLRSFKQVHAQIITSGAILDDLVVSRVSQFLGKSVEFVDYALEFLNQIDPCSRSYPFNTLISGYATSNSPKVAFLVYKRIIGDGFLPNLFTFPVVLKSCAKFSGIEEGKQIHGVVVKMGFSSDLYVQNSLLHFYSTCGECRVAGEVFDDMLVRDVVTWTGLISGCVRAGRLEEAVTLFLKMDVEPSITTFVSVLVACGRLGYLVMGKCIHGLIFKHGFGANLVVSNALLDMYVKWECLCDAKQLFHELPERDIISWTCLISGLVQCKCPKESLQLFSDMQISGIQPDKVILTSVLSACSSLGALDCGRWVHEYIDRRGIKWDIHIGTAMVDMYAKCGCIEMALQTFYEMSGRNISVWNALLGGLAMHGHGQEALKHFEEMIRVGVRLNEVTFLAILTACCHSGLVDQGRRHFYQMSQDYNLSPRLEHYGCMVDLLCRAGLLEEAQDIIRGMPMPPDVLIWGALLSSLNVNGNVELAQDILDRLYELGSQDSGVYVLLSNIHATNERWDEVKRLRRSMKEKGMRKVPGSSVIEVDGRAHEFLVGDTNHPRSEDIHTLLYVLATQVQLEGHFSHQFL
ncbi:pentatricopeptide repeat-containing protein At4g38010 [Cornus florida]|uniref:pentatricopeptide repeat-containing protein At4g38010 n=1 Tax=Cornus florida TaxID=4283 RepID=UPI00289C415C|nr:pentatricopeptide repeat-containing protein At4g38010 [Cornus florida]XP_059667023.1 pentatricopeptide repeat-containing protein At4g38010 [Cornus florida]